MIILKISCTDYKKLLFKVSKVRLKAPRFRVPNKFTWFLELYISGSANPRKVIFYSLKLMQIWYWKKQKLVTQSDNKSVIAGLKM